MTEKFYASKRDREIEEGESAVSLANPNNFDIDRDQLSHADRIEHDYETKHVMTDKYGRDNAGLREVSVADEEPDEISEPEAVESVNGFKEVDDVSADVQAVQRAEAKRLASIRREFAINGPLRRDQAAYPEGYSTDSSESQVDSTNESVVIDYDDLSPAQGSREMVGVHRDGLSKPLRFKRHGERQPDDKGQEWRKSWQKHLESQPDKPGFWQKLRARFKSVEEIDELPTKENTVEAVNDKPEVGPDFAQDFFNGGFHVLDAKTMFPNLYRREKDSSKEMELFISNVSWAIENNPKLDACIKGCAKAVYDFASEHDKELRENSSYSSPDEVLARYLAYMCYGYDADLHGINYFQLWLGGNEEERRKIIKRLDDRVRSRLVDSLSKGWTVVDSFIKFDSPLYQELQKKIIETHHQYLEDSLSLSLSQDKQAA